MVAQIRGRQAKEYLAALRDQDPEAARRVVRRVPVEVSRIEQATGTEWLCFEEFLRFLDVAWAELGPEAFRRFSAAGMRRALASPLLGQLWSSASQVFGARPASIVSWCPHLWTLVYKGNGSVDWDPGREELALRDLAHGALASPSWAMATAASLEAVYAMCGQRVTCGVEPTSTGLLLRVAAA